ncbi:(d)CMP kinase [Halobacillus sp. A1]|uniref:(d)CMP kinase n=1 Tax=Halobacillus sp. A1 TaxID=2880262 RepID=UPI0020A633E8|nr:(d)CMP kinase [Halobacillus sp. A1]MCP3030678.1 (d)CMP kinase [Halobacillus sp. A1]
MTRDLAVAIDGPAAAGKSTVAKRVAEKLSYIYVDTGAMYRALTFKAIENSVDLENEDLLSDLLKHTKIELVQEHDGQHVFLDDKDVTNEIRTNEVTSNVSYVAKHARVRKIMVERQQKLVEKRGIVMDGRDIGTHVIPDAEVKIFMIASVKERAERRHKENVDKGFHSDIEELMEDIRKRDEIDSKRTASPLVKAEDAVELDTTSLTIEEVVDQIIAIVNQKQMGGDENGFI